jgi:hypothetical protein
VWKSNFGRNLTHWLIFHTGGTPPREAASRARRHWAGS